MGSGHIGIILIIISVSLITIPAYAESNIVFVEVELNPLRNDEGNEWVRLFNPLEYSVDLSGWQIKSFSHKPQTLTLSETIGACDVIKIFFPGVFLDNEVELLVLYDNDGKVVDTTPRMRDQENNSWYTWVKPNPSCDPSKSQPRQELEFKISQEQKQESFDKLTEKKELEPPEPVGIGFYENKAYEFSFNAPTNWKFQENIDEAQVMIFPQGFSPLLNLDSPKVIVVFENLPESEVPRLNGQEILEFHTDTIRNELGGKLIESDVKDTPWGWEISTEFIYLEDLGFGSSLQLHTEQRAFHFKDREYYTVAYFATDDYYDAYHPVFEGVIDSLVIKGVVVPEFQEIALMVLGSSIVFVIVFARKFSKLTKI